MQTQLLSWQDPRSTFLLNTVTQALHGKGVVHSGFDLFKTPTNDIKIKHNKTGKYFYDTNGVLSDPTGVLVTNEGSVIIDNDITVLPIDTNLGQTNPRWDAIICEHTYANVVGGLQAVYSIIKGVNSANPIKPQVLDERKQIVIGYVYFPPNAELSNSAVVLEEIKYTPKRTEYIYIAAYNSSNEDIQKADFVCSYNDSDRHIINLALSIGNVKLFDGDYKIVDDITIPENVKLTGSSLKTKLNLYNSGIVIDGVENVIIGNFSIGINTLDNSNIIVHVSDCNNIKVFNIFTGYSVNITELASNVKVQDSTNIEVTGIYISIPDLDNVLYAYMLYIDNCINCSIHSNIIFSESTQPHDTFINEYNLIRIHGGKNNILTGNFVSGKQVDYCIVLDAVEDSNITNNIVSKNNDLGVIYIYNGVRTAFTGNTANLKDMSGYSPFKDYTNIVGLTSKQLRTGTNLGFLPTIDGSWNSNQVVMTNSSKKLSTFPVKSAFNKNFGLGNTEVSRGNHKHSNFTGGIDTNLPNMVIEVVNGIVVGVGASGSIEASNTTPLDHNTSGEVIYSKGSNGANTWVIDKENSGNINGFSVNINSGGVGNTAIIFIHQVGEFGITTFNLLENGNLLDSISIEAVAPTGDLGQDITIGQCESQALNFTAGTDETSWVLEKDNSYGNPQAVKIGGDGCQGVFYDSLSGTTNITVGYAGFGTGTTKFLLKSNNGILLDEILVTA